jgi:outer membrane lipoprotein-sorting protein
MRPLSRRAALSLGLAVACVAAPALALTPDENALEARAIAYLEGLTSAKGRFVQTGPRGDTAAGVLYVARPGRARFEYDPPSGLLLTSDGKTVTLSDSRLKTVHRYPLSSTPLGLFLGKQIRLDRGVKVTAVTRTAAGFSITALDLNGEARGEITLQFADNPLRLTGWSVLDAQRKTTRVELHDFGPSPTPPADLFGQTRPNGQAG